MIWVRKSLGYLLSLILLIVLLIGVLAFNLNDNFSKPTNIKTWLAQSKVYDHFVSEVISQSQQSIGGSSQSNSVSLSDATVQQAASTAFSPDVLQNAVNTFLDANYAWLQDKTSKPQFTIDLSQAKQNFATQVGQYVQARFASLPVCTSAQLAQLQNTDPLSAPCRPANLTAAAEGAQVTQQLAASGDFLSNPVLTADNLHPKGKSSSQPYYQKLSFLPKVYHWSSLAPAILAGVAVLLAVAIIFILPSRRQGLRRIGIIVLEAGLLLVAAKFLSDFAFNKVQAKVFNTSHIGQLQQSLTDVMHHAESAMTTIDLYFGIGFLVLAVILIVFLIITRSRSAKPAPKTEIPLAPANNQLPASTPTQPTSTDSPRPRPSGAPPLKQPAPRPKPPKLIQ